MTGLRIAASLTGVALLCATAHVTIDHTGGYGTPDALLTMGIAYGTGIGALCVGVAWSVGRKVLAGWLLAAILAGEAFGLLSAAKNVVVVDAAAGVTEQGRAELSQGLQAVEHELSAARAALTDRVGVSVWLIALLSSLAANGLGCGLLAYGAHEHRHDLPAPAPAPSATRPWPSTEMPKRKLVIRKNEHAAQFAVERLRPSDDGDATDLLAIHREYERWCKERGVKALSASRIGAALAQLFDGAGISIVERNGARVVLGVAITKPQVSGLDATEDGDRNAVPSEADQSAFLR